jgi:hypothetical protein
LGVGYFLEEANNLLSIPALSAFFVQQDRKILSMPSQLRFLAASCLCYFATKLG